MPGMLPHGMMPPPHGMMPPPPGIPPQGMMPPPPGIPPQGMMPPPPGIPPQGMMFPHSMSMMPPMWQCTCRRQPQAPSMYVPQSCVDTSETSVVSASGPHTLETQTENSSKKSIPTKESKPPPKFNRVLCAFVAPPGQNTKNSCEEVQNKLPTGYTKDVVSFNDIYMVEEEVGQRPITKQLEESELTYHYDKARKKYEITHQNPNISIKRISTKDMRKYVRERLKEHNVLFTKHIDGKNLMKFIAMILKDSNFNQDTKIILFCPKNIDQTSTENLFSDVEYRNFEEQYDNLYEAKKPDKMSDTEYKARKKKKFDGWKQNTNRQVFIDDATSCGLRNLSETTTVYNMLGKICKKKGITLYRYDPKNPNHEEMAQKITEQL
jgi:hypothetical protein